MAVQYKALSKPKDSGAFQPPTPPRMQVIAVGAAWNHNKLITEVPEKKPVKRNDGQRKSVRG